MGYNMTVKELEEAIDSLMAETKALHVVLNSLYKEVQANECLCGADGVCARCKMLGLIEGVH